MSSNRTGPLMAAAMALALAALGPATADAAPNLAAALGPDLAKLPDWTGLWNLRGPLIFPGEADYRRMPKPATDEGGFDFAIQPGDYFVGAPYKPQYQAQYDATVKRAREKFEVDDPIGNCNTPHGMPRVMGGGPGAIQIDVTPTQTTMIWDYMNMTRRIYTDGRKHPTGDDAWPTVMGHSIGHWEGDTLVVDTVDMQPNIYDRTGAPSSDQVHLMERIRKIDDNTIEDQMTIEDPVMFTKPWIVTRQYRKNPRPMVNVEGQYCQNDRNRIVNGVQTAVLAADADKPVTITANTKK